MGYTEVNESKELSGEIKILYVHTSYQRQGIGRKLLLVLAADLASKGAKILRISTYLANTPARDFYETLGGKLIAERTFEDEGHRHDSRYPTPELSSFWRCFII